MPDKSDKSISLHPLTFEEAIKEGISIAPGLIFSPCTRYQNFIRLSFGHPWSEAIEQSIAWLGSKVRELAA